MVLNLNDPYEKQHGRDYLWYPVYQLLEDKRINTVLNIGGGICKEWIDLVDKFDIRVHVIDEYEGDGADAENMLELEKKILKKGLSKKITYQKIDIFEWTGGSAQFDFLYARNALHHIIVYSEKSKERFLSLFSRLHRCLKKGGHFYIREVGRTNYFQYLKPIFPKITGHVNHRNKINMEEYVSYLEETGFEIIDRKYYVPRKVMFLKPFLENKLANCLLTSDYMILARKK